MGSTPPVPNWRYSNEAVKMSVTRPALSSKSGTGMPPAVTSRSADMIHRYSSSEPMSTSLELSASLATSPASSRSAIPASQSDISMSVLNRSSVSAVSRSRSANPFWSRAAAAEMRPKATGSGSTQCLGSKSAGSGPSPSAPVPCLV